jgi:hypothetical protein
MGCAASPAGLCYRRIGRLRGISMVPNCGRTLRDCPRGCLRHHLVDQDLCVPLLALCYPDQDLFAPTPIPAARLPHARTVG